MEFDGTFELEEVTTEEVWFALSDPVMIKQSLPGCQFLLEVDEEDPDFDELRERAPDEDPPTIPEADPDDIFERAFYQGGRYAALIEVSVGSVSPSFETVVTISEREFPEMRASGEGGASDSSFEMNSWMGLEGTDDGVAVEWRAQTDVYGRIARMGQRVMNPVANRIVNRFFNSVADRVSDVRENRTLRDRIQGFV